MGICGFQAGFECIELVVTRKVTDSLLGGEIERVSWRLIVWQLCRDAALASCAGRRSTSSRSHDFSRFRINVTAGGILVK